MRILILVPFYKQLSSKTCKCLLDLTCKLPSHKIEFSIVSVDNTYLHGARETLFEQFKVNHKDPIYGGFDWILHIDSDQTFIVKDVLSLLKHAKENSFSVLSGIYFGRTKEQVTPVLMRKLEGDTRLKMARVRNLDVSELKGEYYRIASLPKKKFFEVDVIGFGFFVCKPKVYFDIQEKFVGPVFNLEINPCNGKIKGEDVVWCEKARACGYKLMVDKSVIIGHMGGEVTFRDYKAWMAERWLALEKENEAFNKEGLNGKEK